MTLGKRYVLVEGHGEVEAMGNLLVRISQQLGDYTPWTKPLRWNNLHQWKPETRGGILSGVEHIRLKQDVASLLVIRDEDDHCPKETAPSMAAQLRTLAAPFPIAYVLLKPEYEVLFLPCIETMAGRMLENRPGLLPGSRWDGAHWEAYRGVKEWLSARFPKGRSYKPSLDQLPMTRMLDLDQVAAADIPCFGSLTRALMSLYNSTDGVYP